VWMHVPAYARETSQVSVEQQLQERLDQAPSGAHQQPTRLRFQILLLGCSCRHVAGRRKCNGHIGRLVIFLQCHVMPSKASWPAAAPAAPCHLSLERSHSPNSVCRHVHVHWAHKAHATRALSTEGNCQFALRQRRLRKALLSQHQESLHGCASCRKIDVPKASS
jgi:hypothetical protein